VLCKRNHNLPKQGPSWNICCSTYNGKEFILLQQLKNRTPFSIDEKHTNIYLCLISSLNVTKPTIVRFIMMQIGWYTRNFCLISHSYCGQQCIDQSARGRARERRSLPLIFDCQPATCWSCMDDDVVFYWFYVLLLFAFQAINNSLGVLSTANASSSICFFLFCPTKRFKRHFYELYTYAHETREFFD
jgi:hypothetical protein